MANADFNINHLLLSKAVLDFLDSQKKKNAYFDLINRVAFSSTIIEKAGKNITLQPGMLAASATELAEHWNWSRQSVYRFLDDLEKLGQIKIERTSKYMIITFETLAFSKTDYNCNNSIFIREDGLCENKFVSAKDICMDTNNISQSFHQSSISYTAEQKQKITSVVDEMLCNYYRRIFCKLFTPDVELSVLDIYYSLCKGNGRMFDDIVSSIINNKENPIHDMITDLLDDIRRRTIEIISATAKNISQTSASLAADRTLAPQLNSPLL